MGQKGENTFPVANYVFRDSELINKS